MATNRAAKSGFAAEAQRKVIYNQGLATIPRFPACTKAGGCYALHLNL